MEENILYEKGITKEKLEEWLTNYLSLHNKVTVVKCNPYLFRNTGIQYDIYRVPISYIREKDSSISNIEFIAKVFTGITEDYSSELYQRNELIYEGQIAELTELVSEVKKDQLNLHIPRLLGYNKNILLLEYLGESTLEKELITKHKVNISLIEKIIQTLAEVHMGLKKIDRFIKIRGDREIPIQKNYTEKFVDNYLKGIFEARGIQLTDLLKDEFREAFEPINRYLEHGAITGDNDLHVIHSDFHPGHIFIDSPIKFIDFRLTTAPVQFDLFGLLENPLVYENLKNRDEIVRLISFYYHKISDKSVSKTNKLGIYLMSGIYRSIRAAAKSSWLELKHPDKYKKVKELNPRYPDYSKWHLSHLNELFEDIKTNGRIFNIPKEDANKIENLHKLLEENIEEVANREKIRIFNGNSVKNNNHQLAAV